MTFAQHRKQLRRQFIKELQSHSKPTAPPKVFKPNPGAQAKALKILMKENPYAFCIWGGIGSGKSWLGCAFLVWQCLHYPERQKLILAGSFDQLKNASLTALARFCKEYGVELTPSYDNPQDTARFIAIRRQFHINGNPVLCSTADHFSGGSELGRGQEVRTIWFDEADYHADAFKSLLGRFPRGPGKGGTFLCTTSINYMAPFDGRRKTAA